MLDGKASLRYVVSKGDLAKFKDDMLGRTHPDLQHLQATSFGKATISLNYRDSVVIDVIFTDKPMDEQKFKIGDVVELNSGGPLMTVVKMEGGWIGCGWHVGDSQPCDWKFPPESLTKRLPHHRRVSGVVAES